MVELALANCFANAEPTLRLLFANASSTINHPPPPQDNRMLRKQTNYLQDLSAEGA